MRRGDGAVTAERQREDDAAMRRLPFGDLRLHQGWEGTARQVEDRAIKLRRTFRFALEQRHYRSCTATEGDRQPQEKLPLNINASFEVCCSSDHYNCVLNGLYEQRQKDLFCDVVLIAEGTMFPAHRNILAGCSNYFNSMFTLGMRENFEKEVELLGTTSVGCKAVLDFLYGCKVCLKYINVYCILKTAHLLQVWKLVDMCCEYLQRKLNAENYLHLQVLASTYSLELLDSSIDRFVLRNFGKLCSTPDFIENVSVEKLCLYLDSDQVQQKVEHDLLKAALQWLSHCPERAKEAYNVLQNIRFSLIPKCDLIDLVKPAVCSLLSRRANCKSLIYEAIDYHYYIPAQPVLQNRRSTPRAEGEQLIYLAGAQTDALCLFFLDPKRGKHIYETQLPVKCGNCCVAVLGNFIFWAGGFSRDGDRHIASKIVYRYDPRWRQWTKVAPMKQARALFSLVVIDGRLVAVGGKMGRHDILGSVEIYDPWKNFWSFVAKLPRPSCGHAGTTYKQLVYISGGVSERKDSRPTNALLCYDYRTNTWEEMMSMSRARRFHAMCTLHDKIYAIGNDHVLDANDMSVECYSPKCDQWTTVAPLLQNSHRFGATVWRGAIHVLGESSKPPAKALVYDQVNDIWFKGPDIPRSVIGPTVCVCVLKSKADAVKSDIQERRQKAAILQETTDPD